MPSVLYKKTEKAASAAFSVAVQNMLVLLYEQFGSCRVAVGCDCNNIQATACWNCCGIATVYFTAISAVYIYCSISIGSYN